MAHLCRKRLLFGPPRGVAQPGSALRSGRRGPQFKSGHPDWMRGDPGSPAISPITGAELSWGHAGSSSCCVRPDDQPVVADVEGWKIGLSICYDVRFPELYRILTLEGAQLVTVPAHFTTPTGKDHWNVLLRARAIENQLYVVAAAQIGETLPGKPAYGRSLIADPWGVVVAQAPDEETVIAAELDRAHLENIRAKLPSLANRQPNAYRWPTRV